MACYHPLQAYKTPEGDVIFSSSKRDTVLSLQLPCGQCVGCRLERSRQWAIRCLHESSLHKRNCFLTLTYDEASCPVSLVYRDFQLFMKRLRKFAACRVRFYMCGEYGEEFNRPHFHAIIFGYDFSDKVVWKRRAGQDKLYRSKSLEILWPFGFSSIGAVNFESAAYVARYVMKKITGDQAFNHYTDMSTGEMREPEFNHMSLKPGVGAKWLGRFGSDVYGDGFVVINGRKVRAPKYYDRSFAKQYPDEFALLCLDREKYAREHFADTTVERLAVREEVTCARLRQLSRKLI